jgi:hypothetical protein
MDWNNVQDFLWMLIEGILVIAVPLAIKAGLDWMKEQVTIVRTKLTSEQNRFIDEIVAKGIRVAQQLKASGELDGGAAAKNYALSFIQSLCDKYNIKVDVSELSDRIEAEYIKMNVDGVDGWIGKDEIIQEAVALIARSAKDSDMIGTVKKYLASLGINIDEAVLSGLVDLKVKLP